MLTVVDKPSQSSSPQRPEFGDADRPDGLRRIDVRELLGERREVLIVHGGREYRLRVTNNGKLILTA